MRVLLFSTLCVGLIACRISSDEKSIENIQIDLNSAVSSYTSFYENGMTKLTGPGFEKFYRNMVSSKDGEPMKEVRIYIQNQLLLFLLIRRFI